MRWSTQTKVTTNAAFWDWRFTPITRKTGVSTSITAHPYVKSALSDWSSTSHVSEFSVSDEPNRADPDSERVLLRVDELQLNHSGGQIAFGPDDYRYISLGDGGANDEDVGHIDNWYEVSDGGNAQGLATNLLGTLLRIDVDARQGGKAYSYSPGQSLCRTKRR